MGPPSHITHLPPVPSDLAMALSRIALRRSVRSLAAPTQQLVRSFHSSRPVRATGSTSHHDDDEHYPSEGECSLLAEGVRPREYFTNINSFIGFNTPIWRNTILLMIGAVGVYRVSTLHGDIPSTTRSIDPDSSKEDDGEGEDNRPFLTRYMDYYSTPSSFWKERNERHLDAVREKAEEKLLFQDAERPPVHRFRYAG